MKKGLFAVVLACICAMACMFGLVACNDEEGTTSVESVTLNKTELTLEVGGEETLTATVAPDDTTDKTVTWTSDNTAIATVENGKVTAVAAGNATITAKAGDKTAACAVTVNAAVTYTVTEDGWNEALDLESISNLTIRVTVTQKGATAPMRSIINNLYDDGKWSASQQTLDGDGNVLYENLVYYNLTGGKNEYGAFGADQYYLNNDIWTKQTNSRSSRTSRGSSTQPIATRPRTRKACACQRNSGVATRCAKTSITPEFHAVAKNSFENVVRAHSTGVSVGVRIVETRAAKGKRALTSTS